MHSSGNTKMFRSYQGILPCSNKLLQMRWDQKYYTEHRRLVKEAQPMVDTKAPATYIHLHLKLKKLQLEEERLATIERDNRILLEKMSYIMRTQGRVDNRNNYEYKSLNREKRQRELLRVTKENQAILKRIMMRKPEYSATKWQNEWEENQAFLDNISHFPKDWWLETGKITPLPKPPVQPSPKTPPKKIKEDDAPDDQDYEPRQRKGKQPKVQIEVKPQAEEHPVDEQVESEVKDQTEADNA